MSSDLNHAVDINFDIIDDDERAINHSDTNWILFNFNQKLKIPSSSSGGEIINRNSLILLRQVLIKS